MGKKSRQMRSAGPRAAGPGAVALAEPGAPIPVVGGREPCPCGSGKRYKGCHGRASRDEFTRLVTRPFEGIDGECDLIAMREIVPAALAKVHTSVEYGDLEVALATVLPMAWPGLHRADGDIFAGLQTASSSGDASRDVGAALVRAMAVEPGHPVSAQEEPGIIDGQLDPRLQDMLAPGTRIVPTLYDGFDFWLGEGTDITPDVRESLERANGAVIPSRRLTGVDAAYWAKIDDRRHLRWVLPYQEDSFLDGLARLHAAGDSTVGEGSRYIGSFRAHGLVVPVWDLADGTEPDDVEKPAGSFVARLQEAMAAEAPLTVLERGARAGLASRQLTLR